MLLRVLGPRRAALPRLATPPSSLCASFSSTPSFSATEGTSSPVQLRGIKADGSTKRFFKAVGVQPFDPRLAGADDDVPNPIPGASGVLPYEKWFAPTLAGRLCETPAGHVLCVPSQRLAEAIALEWDSQGEYVRPVSMPLMHIAATALDQIDTHRPKLVENFTRFVETDTICQRARNPAKLVRLQAKHWDPLLGWAEDRFDAKLQLAFDVERVDQDTRAVDRLLKPALRLNNWDMAVLDSLCSTTKSYVIGLAGFYGRLGVDGVYKAARVDEEYQMREWGAIEDGPYSHLIDMTYVRMKLAAAMTWLNFVREENEGAIPPET